MGEFRMPSLGADMTRGTLVEWLVKPGDEVHRGDIVAVVDTEKAAIEVEVFEDGVVDRVLVDPGAHVLVGTPLALLRPIGAPSRCAGEGAVEPEPVERPPVQAAPARRPALAGAAAVTSPLVRRLADQHGVDLTAVPGSGPGGRITRADVAHLVRPAGRVGARRRVSPLARRAAERLGVDLAAVAGSGPGGAIVVADVEQAAGPELPEQARPEQPLPGDGGDRREAMQRAIANLMARSNREIPHYYLATHIDLGRSQAWLEQQNLQRPVARRLLTAVLLLKAVALAARDHREFNGFWLDDRFQPGAGVHLGVALALRGGGLVAPALHDADRASLDQLMARLRDLIARARAGKLRGSEMADPTLTVTSLGDQGVEGVYGVIYPPQVALVGFGRIVERPWAEGGMVGVRPVVLATLAADHRASNGHSGALFLGAIDRYLQKPEEL
jgi:pyruvate dehydrogenase E2 component (dihydrolipoamide acetyltransferase)